jgi:hypothetical protein
MHDVSRMLSAVPNDDESAPTTQAACVSACFTCEAVCITCADTCRLEPSACTLCRCIRLNQDCADLCAATARLAARALDEDTDVLRVLVHLCARVCAACAAECRAHADVYEHCRVCAEVCERCASACHDLFASLGASVPAARHELGVAGPGSISTPSLT